MATFIQHYKDGYIARDGEKYQYVVKEKVAGTYASVEELVAGQEKESGKQAEQSDAGVSEAKPAKVATKRSAKKTAKKASK